MDEWEEPHIRMAARDVILSKKETKTSNWDVL
jgi:hypothetical protein